MRTPDGRSGNHRIARILWAASSLFVVYGTTIPFRFGFGPGGWPAALASINWHPLGVRGDISLPDLVQNVLLFLPIGFLGLLSLPAPRTGLHLAAVVAFGASLSGAVEFLQLFTADRVTSLSDVLCNAAGTALGALAALRAAAWTASLRHARLPAFLAAPSAYPALVFTGTVLAGAWMPFDITLDVSAAAGKARAFLADPVGLSFPGDEGAAFLRTLLAAFFLGRWAGEARPGRSSAAGTFLIGLFLAAAACGLEATQLVFSSRSPSLQDAFAAASGAWAGAALSGFRGFSARPAPWASASVLAVAATAALAGLHPFDLAEGPARWNWLPFLSEYADTSFASLANFLESVLLLFPLGYLLGYLHPGRGTAPAAAALALALAAVLEAGQAHIAGRYADVTDVIGAVLGALLGWLAAARGAAAYREWVEG